LWFIDRMVFYYEVNKNKFPKWISHQFLIITCELKL
jgi:hypothetical protein